jgi:DNA-binding transcriptional LysR family regulator
MKATLEQFEAFYWISTLGSFRAAADQLNVTQPTMSVRIRCLEQALDLKLFAREGRGIRLTDEGKSLLPDVDQILKVSSKLTQRRASDVLGGVLRLGAPATVALDCISQIIDELERNRPDLHVELTINKSSVLEQLLNDREIDVAIIVEPAVKAHIRVVQLGFMRHAWIASPTLGLSGRTVTPSTLLPYRIFMQSGPSMLITKMMTWFGSAGLEPKRLSHCDNINVIAHLVAAGKGVSILSPAIFTRELKRREVEILKCRPALVPSRLCLAYQVAKAGAGLDLVMKVMREAVASSSLLG